MLLSLIIFIIGFTMGGLNYVTTVLQATTRSDLVPVRQALAAVVAGEGVAASSKSGAAMPTRRSG